MLVETPNTKAIGTRVDLSTIKPTRIARVGQGTLISIQHDVPDGYIVDMFGTTASHREIPDGSDGVELTEEYLAKRERKGVLAMFTKIGTLSGNHITTINLALNGLKFALRKIEDEKDADDVQAPTASDTAVSPKELDWGSLRNLAKSLGINALGVKREDLEAAVEKALEGDGSDTPAPKNIPAADVTTATLTFTCK